MTQPIISVQNLSKSYLVGHESDKGQQYQALRDVISQTLRVFGRNARSMLQGKRIIPGDTVEEFWALDDISFDLFPGEVLGVVGGNGAGKSTLLKVLSRITEPTRGRIILRGKVASLLEVGTGFHPELTGRENIYLNGAILGMNRAEIRQKFDEIVAFAEVERFLDTPVKRYSSGMYVRLAFAVAAHLDPEILIVDEVLAVGDVGFQKKCLGKMQDVAREQGRTVLFVSHNMAAIKTLCSRAICLERGRLVANDVPDVVLHKYLRAGSGELFNGHIPDERPRQFETGELRFTQIELFSHEEPIRTLETGATHQFAIRFRVQERLTGVFFELGVTDTDGRQLTQSRFPLHGETPLHLEEGEYQIRVNSDVVIFPGDYSVLLAAHQVDGQTIDWVERALDFTVLNAAADNPNHHPWSVRGFMRPADEWSAPEILHQEPAY